jgi:hypothetical protein
VRQDYRLEAVARQVSGQLSNARIQAVMANTDIRVIVLSATTYSIDEETSPGNWTPRETFEMPPGMTIGTTGAFVQFQYRGNATANVALTVTNPNANTRQVLTETSGRSYVQ